MPEEYEYTDSFSSRLAVFCSDERFVKNTIKFLKDSLGIVDCDLMIIPGGPEFIARGKEELLGRLQVLMEAHKISQIILISHGDCGYYNKCYPESQDGYISDRQVEDLKEAKRRLDILYPDSSSKGFYGRIKNPGIIEFVEIS